MEIKVHITASAGRNLVLSVNEAPRSENVSVTFWFAAKKKIHVASGCHVSFTSIEYQNNPSKKWQVEIIWSGETKTILWGKRKKAQRDKQVIERQRQRNGKVVDGLTDKGRFYSAVIFQHFVNPSRRLSKQLCTPMFLSLFPGPYQLVNNPFS